jgi:hypothetical protein
MGRSFYDNLDEILNECKDQELKNKIYYNIREMTIYLEAMEKKLGSIQFVIGNESISAFSNEKVAHRITLGR